MRKKPKKSGIEDKLRKKVAAWLAHPQEHCGVKGVQTSARRSFCCNQGDAEVIRKWAKARLRHAHHDERNSDAGSN
jgi:hypothetical protein